MSKNLEFQKKLRLLIEEEMMVREGLKGEHIQYAFIELAAYKAAEDVAQEVICALNKHYSNAQRYSEASSNV